jgi:hypothetical protein
MHFRDFVPSFDANSAAPRLLNGKLHHMLYRYGEQMIGSWV